MMMVVVMPVGLIIAAVCKGRVTIMVMVTQTRSMTMMIMIFWRWSLLRPWPATRTTSSPSTRGAVRCSSGFATSSKSSSYCHCCLHWEGCLLYSDDMKCVQWEPRQDSPILGFENPRLCQRGQLSGVNTFSHNYNPCLPPSFCHDHHHTDVDHNPNKTPESGNPRGSPVASCGVDPSGLSPSTFFWQHVS